MIYPSVDESFARLHPAGWSIGETGGADVWLVLGSNGENIICAKGRTQTEAWYRATLQAQAVGMLEAQPPDDWWQRVRAARREQVMDPEQAQESSERDQLWASLRALGPEINRLAAGQIDFSDRQRQIISVLARIVVAEMDYRAKRMSPE